MDEIRCPMCGKPNPADRDECLHCGARLKPLFAQSGEDAGRPPQESAPSPADEPEGEATLPPMPEGEIPDWLQALRPEGEDAGPAAEDEGEAVLGETELPDWLKEPSPAENTLGEEPDLSGTEGGLPDWPFLSAKPDEGGTDPGPEPGAQPGSEPEPEAPEAASEGELPDWLLEPSPAESALDEEPDLSGAEGGLPDWPFLSAKPDEGGTDPGAQPGPEPEPEAPEAASEAELPDWLLEPSPAESALEEEPDLSGAEGGLPDWPFLSQEPAAEPAFDEETQPPAPEGEQEAEHAGYDPFSAEEEPLTPEAQEPESELPEPPALEEPAAGLAAEISETESGLPELEGAQAFDLPEEEGSAAAYPFEPEEADLDWLRPEDAPQPAGETPERVAPFEAGFEGEAELLEEGELPGWLTGEGEAQAESEAPAQAGPEPVAAAPDDLDEARVPGWLAEMRPVDPATLPEPVQEAPESEVSSGPLSGLKGILPAEPDVARAKRAPVYSVKLQVAESQAAHVQLFTELIEAEGAARPRSGRAAAASSRVARLLIFLVLLGAVLWPALIGSQSTALPQVPAEIEAAGSLIDALPAGAPVLLAVDFEPGFSGELEAASSAVVDHLMRQGAYLAFVSTTATGPLQAERLVSDLNLNGGHAYLGLDQYANLGYIPGGPAGLRAFAETPRRTLPFALSGEGAAADRIWSSGALQGVEQLSDFALALVLTENPDTARVWIEQVQPMLGSAPLVVVASAQADPLIRPYFEGQPAQVEGLVSGLAGGAAYESYSGRAGAARGAWDAFALSLPAAAALIVLGALVALISSSTSSRRRRRQGGSR